MATLSSYKNVNRIVTRRTVFFLVLLLRKGGRLDEWKCKWRSMYGPFEYDEISYICENFAPILVALRCVWQWKDGNSNTIVDVNVRMSSGYRIKYIFLEWQTGFLSYFVSNLVVILMYVNFFAICFLCKQEIQFVKQDCGYRKHSETPS